MINTSRILRHNSIAEVSPCNAHAPGIGLVSPSPRPTSVLLVDDDAAVRTSLRLGLELAGFRVEEAIDGNRALAHLRTGAFDWMVTDIVMPDCEGLELLRMVRTRYPQTRIIAMSGGGLGFASDYLRTARFLGAEQVLKKPFVYSELVAVLAK